MNKQIHRRTFANLSVEGLDGLRDEYSILNFSPRMAEAFRADPFARPEDVVQVVGSVDGVAAGSVFSLPLEVGIGKEIHRTAAGCEMTVVEKFRNTQFGLKLPVSRLGATPEKFMVGCSQSQMMIKVSEFIGSTIFYSPRLVMLFKSRSVMEMKLHGLLGKLVQWFVDCGLWFYWRLAKACARSALKGYEMVHVTIADEECIRAVADIIRVETPLCGEVHDERWIKWHLSNSFSENGPLLLTVLHKDGKPVAFYMTKRRFYEQASHRGFKNVWLGSVVEWGALPEHANVLNPMLMMAAASFGNTCDAVELVATETRVEKHFRKWGWRHVGDSNYVFKVADGSALLGNEEMRKRENWRLRPAMGDNGMS